MIVRSLLAAALTAVFVNSAAAETTAQIFQSFGLIGTWAVNCKAAASDSNLYMVFSAQPDGSVRREYFNGPKPHDTYQVDNAKVSGAKITFHTFDLNIPDRPYDIGPFDREYYVDILLNDGQIRVWGMDHVYRGTLIADGRAIDSKIATEWQSKCR